LNCRSPGDSIGTGIWCALVRVILGVSLIVSCFRSWNLPQRFDFRLKAGDVGNQLVDDRAERLDHLAQVATAVLTVPGSTVPGSGCDK
jgi:hypothetical protein